MRDYKRLTIICGHYGSGKTNIAVNMALELCKIRENVAVADLDIVNPYFRTKDSEEDFKANGIKLICSQFANTNLDLPSLPADLYSITDDKETSVILDIGGDDRGAFALGRLSPEIIKENNYDMYYVINKYRPLTPDAESAYEIMLEIEAACGIKFTGILNNSNLGSQTSAEDVLNSLEFADRLSEISSLPVKATCIEKRLEDELKDKIPNLFSMKLQNKIIDG
ncbi:MAG: hypothetical protein MJ080_00850 [Clostridia bacterium]|nr:hypothetical protein [Clostridia bacterium]